MVYFFFFPQQNFPKKIWEGNFTEIHLIPRMSEGQLQEEFIQTLTEKIYMVWGNDAWSCHGQEVFLHSKDSQGALHSSPAAAKNIAIQPTGLNMYQSQYRQFHLSKILQKLEFHQRFKLGMQTVTHTCLKIHFPWFSFMLRCRLPGNEQNPSPFCRKWCAASSDGRKWCRRPGGEAVPWGSLVGWICLRSL